MPCENSPSPPASGHYCLSSQTSLLVCPGNTGRLPGPLSPRPAPVGPPWNGHVHRHAPAKPSQMPQHKHLLILSVLIAFGLRHSDNRLNAARFSFFLSLSRFLSVAAAATGTRRFAPGSFQVLPNYDKPETRALKQTQFVVHADMKYCLCVGLF